MSHVKQAVFTEENLFLKVLVEGEASLYSYEDGNLFRFFYGKDNAEIEQLVSKKYKVTEFKVAKNQRFRQQLLNDLKCSTFTVKKIENLDYKKDELADFFIDYNKCNNQEFSTFEKKQKKDLFNLSIRPGFNSSSLSIQNAISNTREADFDNEFGFRFGVEAEIIFPFNKNKWAILIEPTYQYFKSEKEWATSTQDIIKINYKSIELPVGVRHYFFLNERSKIFINGSFVFDFGSDSRIDFSFVPDLELKTGTNLAFGVGYKLLDRYSFELRYQTSRSLLVNYINWGSDYTTLSAIIGYSLF